MWMEKMSKFKFGTWQCFQSFCVPGPPPSVLLHRWEHTHAVCLNYTPPASFTHLIPFSSLGSLLACRDTAGQERFRTITHNYYRGAHGIALIYDVTNDPSFLGVRNWISGVKQYADESVAMVLIGNKCDLAATRAVEKSAGQQLADEYVLCIASFVAQSIRYFPDWMRSINEHFRGCSTLDCWCDC